MYPIKIYKIVNDCDDEIYVGSTRNKLSKRMSCHRTCAKTLNNTVYVKMRELGVEHFRIVLIATYEVDNCEEQRQREQEHIDELQPVLNRRRAHTTDEQHKEQDIAYRKLYYVNNKEKLNARAKEYYVNNKEQLAAYNKEYQRKTVEQKKFACDACGYSGANQANLARHNQSKRHALTAHRD